MSSSRDTLSTRITWREGEREKDKVSRVDYEILKDASNKQIRYEGKKRAIGKERGGVGVMCDNKKWWDEGGMGGCEQGKRRRVDGGWGVVDGGWDECYASEQKKETRKIKSSG